MSVMNGGQWPRGANVTLKLVSLTTLDERLNPVHRHRTRLCDCQYDPFIVVSMTREWLRRTPMFGTQSAFFRECDVIRWNPFPPCNLHTEPPSSSLAGKPV